MEQHLYEYKQRKQSKNDMPDEGKVTVIVPILLQCIGLLLL